MPKFDDLTPLQRKWLTRVVTFGRHQGEATFSLRFWRPGCSPVLTAEASTRRYESLPADGLVHQALAQAGYLYIPEGEPHRFTLCQRAYDCVDHWSKRRIPRAWADMVYDLGRDDTIRSKMAWALLAVVASQLVTYGLGRLGVL